MGDDETNSFKYWRVNSGRFPLLSKLAIELYSCPAIPVGIEGAFSVAVHLIGTRATTMKDENFEKKLFCNVNQEVMMSGRKRKFVEFLTSSFEIRSGKFFGANVFRSSFVRGTF